MCRWWVEYSIACCSADAVERQHCMGNQTHAGLCYRLLLSQTLWLPEVQMHHFFNNIKPLSSISCSVSGRELWEGRRGREIQERPEQRRAEEEQGRTAEEQGRSKWRGSESAGVRGAGQRGGAESRTWDQICVCCHETPTHWVRQVSNTCSDTDYYCTYF